MNKKGFSLVELVIAVGVFGLLASGVFYVIIGNYENFYGIGDKQTMSEYAQEGIEYIRNIRDNSWKEIQDFRYLTESNTTFDRVITISDVYRDRGGNISTPSGNILDEDTKLATITISGDGMDDYILQEYLTNWDFNIFEQNDWSEGEFYNNKNKYNTSTNIDTSTQGEIKLNYTQGEDSYDSWNDFDTDASVNLPNYAYDIEFSPDGNTAYLAGNSSFDFRKYDISGARDGTITEVNSLNMPTTTYTIEITEDGNYIFAGYYTSKGVNAIGIIDLNTWKVVGYANTGSNGRIYDFIYDDANSILYALSYNGAIYTYSFNKGSLSSLNSGQFFTTEYRGRRSAINNGVLVGNKLYIVTDDSKKAFVKIDVSNTSNLKEVYSLSNTYDFIDIKYLEKNTYDSFMVATEDGSGEFKVIEDGSKSPKILSSYNLSGSDFKSLIYDSNNDTPVMYDYYGRLFTLDITNRSGAKNGPVKDTTSYYYNLAYTPYNSMEYNEALGGLFILEKTSGDKRMNFIEQPGNSSQGSYSSSGELISSAIDLGSTNKELNSITVNQNVPSNCIINFCLETSDESDFSNPVGICYSESNNEYTKNISDTLNKKRWIRYKAILESCNHNTETPTLNSFKLNYE